MAVHKGRKKQADLIVQGGITAMALLFAGACVLCRHIPLTAIWGDKGNSIYASTIGTFLMACLISSYGLPVAVEGLLKSRLRQRQYRSVGKIMQTAFLYATVTGTGLGVLLFFAGTFVAENVMHEPLSVLPLQILSVAVLLSSWNNAMRGFFLGNGAKFPVVVSVVMEQIFTLGAGFPLSDYARKYGEKAGALLQNEDFALSFAVLGFALGIGLGIILSFLFLLFLYPITYSYYRKKNGKDSERRPERMGQVAASFFAALFPVILFGLFAAGYIVIQQILFRQLAKGSPGDALLSRQWGMYYGKYKLFTAFPAVLTAAMGTVLQGRVSSCMRKESYQQVSDLIQNTLQAVMIIVIPLSVMIGILSDPLLGAFFPGQDGQTASKLLLAGFLTAVFFSASYVLVQALLGMKKTGTVLLCGGAAFAVHIGALYVMLGILELDIFGVLYADMIYSFLLTAFLGAVVRKNCRFRHGLLRSNVPAVIASAVMGLVLFGLTKLLSSSSLPSASLLVIDAAVGCVIYVIVLLLLRGVTERQLRLVPGGKLICMVGKALRLL